ncbi:helicase-related protein [Rhodoligotrophos ferricapiens]|uniref:helicase-related protein n=1 Tax=Rhodoligotrophos ferricapiens TaxID=3069264 RepID=UPI00315DBCB5
MPHTAITDRYQAAERFVDWLADFVVADATGAKKSALEVDPCGLFWLGRLAPEEEIAESKLGERAERLEPCAVGMRLGPDAEFGDMVSFDLRASFAVWRKEGDRWIKSDPIDCTESVSILLNHGSTNRFTTSIQRELDSRFPDSGLAAAIEIEVDTSRDGLPGLTVTLVNCSKPNQEQKNAFARGRLFQCELEVSGLPTREFILEALPDSFRYDRHVPAWGINCGVSVEGSVFTTVDLPRHDKPRPQFWNAPGQSEDFFSFERLADDPVAPGRELVEALRAWGDDAWDMERIRSRHADWSEEMEREARRERQGFLEEVERIAAGVARLEEDQDLCRAFRLMNASMLISARDGKGGFKYTSWRPFQIGFLYANLDACRNEGADIVDIVWFTTGGGKTETYLGLILTAAFLDRFRGKTTGVTAWSRFPLRLLSLQQTQRFANALAAAEMVRRKEAIEGDPFGLGFLVGSGATPNEIKRERNRDRRGQWDYEDDSMPDRLRMLKVCPFCRTDSIEMRFNRRYWRLEHRCTNSDCEWDIAQPLPIWVVDFEVWRYLPTVIVGTLDKAAGIALQANMRGIIGPPMGYCSEPEHGHTYATRWSRPNGCLVPDCKGSPKGLPMDPSLYGVSFRLQDELHLLRDSLGAVDAHYEALYDHLQRNLSGTRPKILASSATLSGYERQSEVLYGKKARVFPYPEPQIGEGFWSRETDKRMRSYLAVSPRGQTVEFAVDRMMISLQSAIREWLRDPRGVAEKIGVDPSLADFLVDIYGTNVVYGNTLRDLDAVVRSSETQWEAIPKPAPNVTSMTGRTLFSDVSEVLEKLERPDAEFANRLHVVAASSMMSHGVDIDRLNVMVMLGLPLTTAEFIQATARVGRRWPALAFVVHRIARERDASVFKAFPQYVAQGDRFVEPIPITGHSRRVLERTLPGLAFARILLLHEPRAGRSIAKAKVLRDYLDAHPDFCENESATIAGMLGYTDEMTADLSQDVRWWYERLAANLGDPAHANEWSNSMGPKGGPMLSLRDVEEQVEIRGEDPR